MSKSPKEFSKAISDAVKEPDIEKVSLLCKELITFLSGSEDVFPAAEAEKIMKELRGSLQFDMMNEVGNAFVKTGRGSFTIYRQFAQAAIERNNFDLALFILNNLVEQTEGLEDKKAIAENAEARGLLGRTYKQLFINATEPVGGMALDYLKKAIPFYKDVYDTDKQNHLWHGINTLTLICRAKKEELDTEGLPKPEILAQEIIDLVDAKEEEYAGAWDYATAAEACVAMSSWDNALKWTKKYVKHPGTNAFALGGTLRQFKQVWQLDKIKDADEILSLLNENYEKKKGLQSPPEIQNKQEKEEKEDEGYQGNYGNEEYKTLEWYEDGLSRCSAVARIGFYASEGKGTGFLIKGSKLSKKLGDDFVLVTNAHVISDDPNVKPAVPLEEAKVIFEKVGLQEVFEIEKIYWTSVPENLDATIVQFYEKDKKRINEIGQKTEPFPVLHAPPFNDNMQRIYIIGHPDGKTLSLSLQDNEMLDFETPRIHYRTPTARGSSGSPVFNRNWRLIGIHHKTNEKMKKLNGKDGTYQANEGIWIQSVINALQAEGK